MELSQTIRANALRLGDGQHKVSCPFCSNTRKKSNQKTMSLKVDDQAVVFNCWHCGKMAWSSLVKENLS